jgi:hypothetical protein
MARLYVDEQFPRATSEQLQSLFKPQVMPEIPIPRCWILLGSIIES